MTTDDNVPGRKSSNRYPTRTPRWLGAFLSDLSSAMKARANVVEADYLP